MGPKLSISEGYKFIQINLHHSKATMPLFYWKLAIGEMDTALIQKPWVYGDWIRGLCNKREKPFSLEPGIAPRSCSCQAHNVCLSTVKVLLEGYDNSEDNIRERNTRELIIVSAYLWFRWTTAPIKGKWLSTAVGIKSNSSLEVMPVHTTLHQRAQT